MCSSCSCYFGYDILQRHSVSDEEIKIRFENSYFENVISIFAETCILCVRLRVLSVKCKFKESVLGGISRIKI